MASTPSSRAGLLLALLAAASSTATAAEPRETAPSIPTASIAAAALPVTGTTSGTAVAGDISTTATDTVLSATAKVTFAAGLGAELGVQAAQPSGGTGALADTLESIASGAQLSLALTFANYDVLPESDPGVQAFRAARKKCHVPSATLLRKKVADLEALRARQQKGALEKDDQEALEAAEKDGCTLSSGDAYWLAERARFKPFLAAVKGTIGRSDAVYLRDATFDPVPDLVRAGVSVAIGQYLASNLVLAGSFRWATGNVITGAPVDVCRQIGLDAGGQPVTQCNKGVLGTPVRGNLFRFALEVRHLVGGGLIWDPSVSISWADLSAPTLRAQLPLFFELISGHEGQSPLLIGLTFGYAQVLSTPPQGQFTIAGTLQTSFALDKL